MGKIKPSSEAIEMFMNSGEQMLKRVSFKLKEIGMEDTYYAILTPSQAALMLHGIPPPSPKETAELMREIFVKKEKMLEPEYIQILRANVELRKKIEHGEKKELSGTELDKYLEDAVKRVGGPPVVIKTPFGSYGAGVVLAETTMSIKSAWSFIKNKNNIHYCYNSNNLSSCILITIFKNLRI